MSASDRHNKTESEPGNDAATVDLASEPDFNLGLLLVRPSSREVVLDNKTEMLEPRVMQVLTILARRRGEVVSREQLIKICWQGRVVSDDAINRSMTKVRRWSTPATFELETIPRVGYRLIAATVPMATPTPSAADTATRPAAVEAAVTTPVPRRYSLRKKILIGVALFVLVNSIFGFWFTYQFLQDAKRPFFAILHFDVMGQEPDANALDDILAATINQRLASQGFRMVSPAQTAQFRGARKSEVASSLDALYVIDGSIFKEGSRVRVAVRVDATQPPVTIWSKEFEAVVGEERALAERISIALGGLFNPALQSSPRLPPQVAAGMLRINELHRQGNDMDAFTAAQELLRDVPDHYTSQIWYAASVAQALDVIPNNERAALLESAREMTERADRAVVNSVPTVRFAVTPPVEWTKREKMLREGLKEQYTDAPSILYLLATLMVSSGRVAEGIDLAKQAAFVNSLSARNVTGYAAALNIAGRSGEQDVIDSAIRQWPELPSGDRLKFGSALSRRDLSMATQLLQDPKSGPHIDPPAESKPLASLLRALATQSRIDIAAVERDCVDPSKLGRDNAAWCLQGLIALNRLDTFFAVAPAYFPQQRATTSSERDRLWLQSPQMIRYVRVLFRTDSKAVRADPRFIPIVERLGLIDYWRATNKWPDFCKTEPDSVCGQMRAQLLESQ